MGTGAVSARLKQQGREADYSPPSSAEVKNGGAIPLLHSVQTGSGDHPASYTMGTEDSFPRGKAAGT
jgi:hypothetical protein